MIIPDKWWLEASNGCEDYRSSFALKSRIISGPIDTRTNTPVQFFSPIPRGLIVLHGHKVGTHQNNLTFDLFPFDTARDNGINFLLFFSFIFRTWKCTINCRIIACFNKNNGLYTSLRLCGHGTKRSMVAVDLLSRTDLNIVWSNI